MENKKEGKSEINNESIAVNKNEIEKKNDGDLQGKHENFDKLSSSVLEIIDRIKWNEQSKAQKARHFPFAFKVTEEKLKKLDKRIREQISKLPSFDNFKIQFSGSVRFSDITTNRYTDLEELIEKAGDQKDPVCLDLKWHYFLSEPVGSTAEIIISFTTEKPLEVEELGLLDFPVASMDLDVSAPIPEWVDSTFNILASFLDSSRIRGIYKPLLIFRNKAFVSICSYSLGILAWVSYIQILNKIKRDNINPSYKTIADKITMNKSIETKFDAFVNEFYGPGLDSSILENVISIAAGLILWITFIIIGYLFFPKLIPRSGINIGLARGRYNDYENVFKLLVFTILLSGVIIPLLRKFLF